VSQCVLLGALLCTACAESPPPNDNLCQSASTSIGEIQDRDWYSPLEGRTLTTRGVVTHVDRGRGLYIEMPPQDDHSEGSRALWVADAGLSRFANEGQLIAATGTVAETGSRKDRMTAIVSVTGHAVCALDEALPLTAAKLPMNARQRESLEGMRLEFNQNLWVTDVYRQRNGELTLSSGNALRVPTEIHRPGHEAQAMGRENRNRSIRVTLPGTNFDAMPAGTQLAAATGVMGHDGKSPLLLLERVAEKRLPAIGRIEPAADGHVRIVSMNLLNFFNGDGRGLGFPTERGAKNPAELRAQKARYRSSLAVMQPDLIGVQELENDGFGEFSAARDLLAVLDSTGTGPWAVIDPGSGPVGNDVITVGLFYRASELEPVGPAQVLDSPEFRGLSRNPVAQVFRHRDSGALFLVAVNHLKSKGRCPEAGANTDLDDGQGCWNQARVDAVNALIPWLQELAANSATARVLVLGDMNAWRREDPIRQFLSAGYDDLVESLSGLPQHSFLYWGQAGTLDYAFASPALTADARTAQIWNINATWPAGMDLPEPWLRMSDHDPVIVDFEFSQSATSR
jgi:predicted extracellular nuclease